MVFQFFFTDRSLDSGDYMKRGLQADAQARPANMNDHNAITLLHV